MKNFCLLLILSFTLFSCKKEIPKPDVVRLLVYSTPIDKHNHNEPNTLYWYVKAAKKGGYFYMATSNDVKDFSEYTFTYALQLPPDISEKSAIKQVVVWVNQLNGEMFFDITGENAPVIASISSIHFIR